MKKSYIALIEAIVIVVAMFIMISMNPHFGLVGFTVYENQPDATAGKDTYIRNGSGSNFDTDVVLKIGKTAGGLEYRTIIEFNLSSIQSGSTILESVTRLYAVTNNQPNITINAYMLTSNWTENQATWDNNATGNTWVTAGGDYNSGLLLDSINVSSTGQVYNISITQAVRRWTNGTSPNYGIILIAPNAGSNNLTEFSSSDTGTPSQAPIIWVSYTDNAVPTLTSISTNSSLASPKNVGSPVSFTIGWDDLEANPSQIFICNSSSITKDSGCGSGTFCNTSASSTTPQTCSYTTQISDNRTSPFWVAACDSINCSIVNQSYFYVNHFPNVTLLAPNGGETINQSQGNYSVRFNVSDSDADTLTFSLYYGESQNATTNAITLNRAASSYCYDGDSTTATTNNCTYSWNTTNIFGTYFLTIILNDTFSATNDSSNASFNVYSLADNTVPNITAQWIESYSVYSGQKVQIYANVTDDNLNSVWFSVNTTPQQNITMRNTTAGMPNLYNGTLTAPAIGIYEFKVYANDTLNNVNSTMPWIQFNVTKPVAVTQNETSPTIALPYTVIQVSGKLNATNPLTDVYAYLNVPSGFTFLNDYPQNTYAGNFTANQTKTVDWFISTPISQALYKFNVTYTDAFSNSWASENTTTNVTTSFGTPSPSLSIIDYPHVAVTGQYYAEAIFRQDGNPTNVDSSAISLYDPVGNLVVGPVAMTQKQTGIYNYSYTVPGAQTAGQWRTIVNVTINSINYYADSFWKLVGALFDVREIQIENTAVDHLNISVLTENVGNAPTDLTLSWNLTRVDNDAVLDYGADTFAVSSTPIRWYVYPDTEYVGQVKITFIGVYSQTEKAGAYEVFSTTAATGTTPTPPSGSSGGGGGGGGSAYVPEEKADLQILIDNPILVAKNIKENVKIIIRNIGSKALTDVVLQFVNLDGNYYKISPTVIDKINSKESAQFDVEFLISDFTGEKIFMYSVSSNEITEEGLTSINVLLPIDYMIAALKKLKDRSAELHARINTRSIVKQLDKCDANIPLIEEDLAKDSLIEAKIKIDDTSVCLDIAEKMIEKKENTFTIRIWKYDISILMLIISIIALLVLIFILYLAIKKINLLFFVRTGEKISSSKSTSNEDFEEKLRRIEEKLKG